jgi:hypothetical protein
MLVHDIVHFIKIIVMDNAVTPIATPAPTPTSSIQGAIDTAFASPAAIRHVHFDGQDNESESPEHHQHNSDLPNQPSRDHMNVDSEPATRGKKRRVSDTSSQTVTAEPDASRKSKGSKPKKLKLDDASTRFVVFSPHAVRSVNPDKCEQFRYLLILRFLH